MITNVLLDPTPQLIRELKLHIKTFSGEHTVLTNRPLALSGVDIRVVAKVLDRRSYAHQYLSILETLRDYAVFPCLYIENDVYKIKNFDLGCLERTYLDMTRPNNLDYQRDRDGDLRVSSDVIWFCSRDMVADLINTVKARILCTEVDLDDVVDLCLFEIYQRYGYVPNDLGCINECFDRDWDKNVLLSQHLN